MTVEIPAQFTDSIKFEETAKGVRISYHMYGNHGKMTIDNAIENYNYARERCRLKNIPLAPMEVLIKKDE